MTEQYVTIESVADKFSVSVSTVRGWIRKGFIPRDTYIKAGNTYRFKLDEIEQRLRSDNQSKDDEHWSEAIVSEDDDIVALDLDEDY